MIGDESVPLLKDGRCEAGFLLLLLLLLLLMSQEARSYDKMDVGDDMMIIMSFCVCVELEFLAVNNSTLIVHLLGKILSWFVLISDCVRTIDVFA